MFVAEYKNGSWNEGSLQPFQKLELSPFSLCLHYGQTVFEGMKAFKMTDGRLNLFRPTEHFNRFNESLERMNMPPVPKNVFMNALEQVIRADEKWFDRDEDSCLYVRPLVIASEEKLGVKVSEEYLFIVMCTPAGKYFVKPIKVKVETNYTRAFEGGTGSAKCGGNYGAAFYPTNLARLQGFDQVIWTDGLTHKDIEESGTMNIMFYADGKLITPALSGTILGGITRNSLLKIAREKGLTVEERKVSVAEIQKWFEEGKQVEAFGTGTAAVIAPIEKIDINGTLYSSYIGSDAMMYELIKEFNNIRYGAAPDKWGWNHVVTV